jgi:hypothetical protein
MKIIILSLLAIFINMDSSQAQKAATKPKKETDKVVVGENKADKNSPKSIVPDTGKVIIKREKKLEHRRLDSIYQLRIRMKDIDGIYIPKDLNDCFKQLDEALDEEVKAQFMDLKDEEADRRSHNTIGKWIEHRWSLLEGSRLSHYFNQMKVPHPDYMVGIILTSYHRHLHKKDLKLKEQVEFFRKIWQEKQRKEAKKIIENGKVKK